MKKIDWESIDAAKDRELIQLLVDDSPGEYLNLKSWENQALFDIICERLHNRCQAMLDDLKQMKRQEREQKKERERLLEANHRIWEIFKEPIQITPIKKKQRTMDHFVVK